MKSRPSGSTWFARGPAFGLVVLAGWDLLRWYVERLGDGSDEPLGLVPLLAAVWFVRQIPLRAPLSRRRVTVLALCLAALFIVKLSGLPPLFCAAFWVVALASVLAPRSCWLAWTGLLGLSLPVMASLLFYLGYPARVLVTWAAAGLLRVVGYSVVPKATLLCWAGERVLIDAPCSGLQMAWTLSVMASIVAVSYRLDQRRAVRLLRWTALSVWLANVFRAAILFALAMTAQGVKSWIHDGFGIGLFVIAGIVVLWRAGRIAATRTSIMPREHGGFDE